MDELDNRNKTVATLPPEFEILGTLGQNTKSVSYKAELRMLKQTVAVKVFNERSADDTKARMKREAMNLAKLDHPNVVRLLQVGFLEDKSPYLVYEFLNGITLEQSINAKKTELMDVHKIFSQILDGLECAHRIGLVHRDMRPSNIMLLMKGTTGIHNLVKVLNFALSKEDSQHDHNSGKATLTPFAELTANPKYTSPEQCCGLPLDARSDLYAVACMLYECLEGSPPYDGNSSKEIIEKHLHGKITPVCANQATSFRKSINALLMKGLAKSPEQRFQSAAEFKANLNKAFALLPAVKDTSFLMRKNGMLIGACMMLVLGGGILIQQFKKKTSPERTAQILSINKQIKKKSGGLKKYGLFPSSQLLGLYKEINYLCDSRKLTIERARELSASLESLASELNERRDRFIAHRLQYRLFMTLKGFMTSQDSRTLSNLVSLEELHNECLNAELKSLQQCELPDGQETIEAAQTHFDIGQVYWDLGQYQQAFDELLKAMKLHDKYKHNPTLAPSLNIRDGFANMSNSTDLEWSLPLYLGRCLLSQDKSSKEGLKYLLLSAELAGVPHNREAQVSLAWASATNGNKPAAMKRLHNYLKTLDAYVPNAAKGSLDTLNLLAYADVGNLLLQLNEPDEAKAAFRRGIAYSKRIPKQTAVLVQRFAYNARNAGISEAELEPLGHLSI